MRKRFAALGVALGVVVGLFAFAPIASAAVEMQVTIYENANGGGDHWTKTGFNNNLQNATLVGDIVGLSGTPLCNSQWWPAAGNDWNDCVSAVQIAGLPSGWRVKFYWNANFAGRTLCTQNNTFFSLGADDDQFSSWRVEQGSC